MDTRGRLIARLKASIDSSTDAVNLPFHSVTSLLLLEQLARSECSVHIDCVANRISAEYGDEVTSYFIRRQLGKKSYDLASVAIGMREAARRLGVTYVREPETDSFVLNPNIRMEHLQNLLRGRTVDVPSQVFDRNAYFPIVLSLSGEERKTDSPTTLQDLMYRVHDRGFGRVDKESLGAFNEALAYLLEADLVIKNSNKFSLNPKYLIPHQGEQLPLI